MSALHQLKLHPRVNCENGTKINDPGFVQKHIELWAKEGDAAQVLLWGRYSVEQWKVAELDVRYWREKAIAMENPQP